MRFVEAAEEALAWVRELGEQLRGHLYLRHIAVVMVLLVVGGGLLEYVMDPAITTPLDGIWYAWITLTHVGYGDLVPASQMGRLIGGVLIVSGFGLFALFMATVTSSLVLGQPEAKAVGRSRASEQEKVMQDILTELTQLRKRLDALEKKTPKA